MRHEHAGGVSNYALKGIAELAAGRVGDVKAVVMDIDVTGAGTAPQLAIV
jgi:hypothetical protein